MRSIEFHESMGLVERFDSFGSWSLSFYKVFKNNSNNWNQVTYLGVATESDDFVVGIISQTPVPPPKCLNSFFRQLS